MSLRRLGENLPPQGPRYSECWCPDCGYAWLEMPHVKKRDAGNCPRCFAPTVLHHSEEPLIVGSTCDECGGPFAPVCPNCGHDTRVEAPS